MKVSGVLKLTNETIKLITIELLTVTDLFLQRLFFPAQNYSTCSFFTLHPTPLSPLYFHKTLSRLSHGGNDF